jgi:hypothetical protein
MYALKPNYRDLKRGVSWTTNSWGLRDREYLRTKPPGTIRIAFLGDSIGAGWGVDDGRSFESLLEAQLDAQSRAAGGPRVEILNFSVPGLAPGQRWENFLRLGGWSLGIDRVVYEATPAEPAWDERRLRVALPLGYGWDAPQYASAFARLSRRSTSDPLAIKQALRANRWILLESVYRHIASECRSHGVEATWVLIPRVGRTTEASERRRLCDLARRAGFAPIIDLSDAFNNQSAGALAVAPNDYHPNAKGHAILAERLSLSVELSSPTARETSP